MKKLLKLALPVIGLAFMFFVCIYLLPVLICLGGVYKIAAIVIIIIIAIHIVSALTYDRRLRYLETAYQAPEVPPELDGYVIAFVTDLHELSPQKQRQIVAKMNVRQIDILLLGGDYARKGGFWQTMEIFGQTKTKDGIYGVDGNHDDAGAVFEAMQRNGIMPLDNAGLYLKPRFYLAGMGDLWRRKADAAQALNAAAPNDFVLLLTHNPDIAMRQDMARVNLVLAGHTHGGIVTLFGLWAPALWLISSYGHKFKGGWTTAPRNTAVFVSRGTGLHKIGRLPVYPRVFAPPQVIFLTLKAKTNEKVH